MAALSVTAANVAKSTDAVTEEGVAGASLTAGMAVYKDASDSNKIKGADADVVTSAAAVGIALHAAASGQPIIFQKSGLITMGATMTKGEHYFAGTTAGELVPLADLASGDFPTRVIQAISTTVAVVQPYALGTAL